MRRCRKCEISATLAFKSGATRLGTIAASLVTARSIREACCAMREEKVCHFPAKGETDDVRAPISRSALNECCCGVTPQR